MATLKQRLYKKNTSGGYDTIHLETSASAVLMSNGTTVEAAINGKAASNHTHSNYAASTHTHTAAQVGAAATNHTHSGYAASSHNHSTANITSGVLPVERGGTGVSTLNDLALTLGDSSAIGHNSVSIYKDTIDLRSIRASNPAHVWLHIDCISVSMEFNQSPSGKGVGVYCRPVCQYNTWTSIDIRKNLTSSNTGSIFSVCGLDYYGYSTVVGTIRILCTANTSITFDGIELTCVSLASVSNRKTLTSANSWANIYYHFDTHR